MQLKLTKPEAFSLLKLCEHEVTNAQPNGREGHAHVRRIAKVGVRLHETQVRHFLPVSCYRYLNDR